MVMKEYIKQQLDKLAETKDSRFLGQIYTIINRHMGRQEEIVCTKKQS